MHSVAIDVAGFVCPRVGDSRARDLLLVLYHMTHLTKTQLYAFCYYITDAASGLERSVCNVSLGGFDQPRSRLKFGGEQLRRLERDTRDGGEGGNEGQKSGPNVPGAFAKHAALLLHSPHDARS